MALIGVQAADAAVDTVIGKAPEASEALDGVATAATGIGAAATAATTNVITLSDAFDTFSLDNPIKMTEQLGSMNTALQLLIDNGMTAEQVLAGMSDEAISEIGALITAAQQAGIEIPKALLPIQTAAAGITASINGIGTAVKRVVSSIPWYDKDTPQAEKYWEGKSRRAASAAAAREEALKKRLGPEKYKRLQELKKVRYETGQLWNQKAHSEDIYKTGRPITPTDPWTGKVLPVTDLSYDQLKGLKKRTQRQIDEILSLSTGTGGRFIDFGSGTPAVLHGRERVMTEAEGSATDSLLSDIRALLRSIDGKTGSGGSALDLAEVIETQRTRARRNLGLR